MLKKAQRITKDVRESIKKVKHEKPPDVLQSLSRKRPISGYTIPAKRLRTSSPSHSDISASTNALLNLHLPVSLFLLIHF